MLLKFGYFVLFLVFMVKGDEDETEYDYHFDRLEPVKENDGYLSLDIHVKKVDKANFLVEGNVDQLQDLTEDMKIVLAAYHSIEADGEMDKPKIKAAKMLCEFMQGPYKNIIYPKFKTTSNIPHYDVCPVPKEKYVIEETKVDMSRFKSFLQPGYWKIAIQLLQDDKILTGINIYGSIVAKN